MCKYLFRRGKNVYTYSLNGHRIAMWRGERKKSSKKFCTFLAAREFIRIRECCLCFKNDSFSLQSFRSRVGAGSRICTVGKFNEI